MIERSAIGRAGEDAAVELLRSLGYEIVGRNVRMNRGEIDAIARDGSTIVFVEVKTRRSATFGSALAAIDARKRRQLRALAAQWLELYAPRERARFDVVTIDGSAIAHHRNAFQ